MLEIRLLLTWVAAAVREQQHKLRDDERGEVLPWVIITALLAAAAIVIVAIIVAKAKTTAQNIKTQ
jgi:hypothetical protein